MTNDEFRQFWDLLNELAEKQAGIPLASLNHGGKIDFARKIQTQLDDFCREVAARAKAEYETHKLNFEHLKERYGDDFEGIAPDYNHGLDFRKPER